MYYRNKRVAHTEIDNQTIDEVLLGESKQLLEGLQNIFDEFSRAHEGRIRNVHPPTV